MEEAGFRQAGIDADFYRYLRQDEILDKVRDAAVLIVQLEQVPGEWLAHMPHLKLIVRCGVGTDNIDLEAATRHRIPVMNVPDYCIEEVAVHACSMILALQRKLPAAQRLVRDDRWRAQADLAPLRRLSALTLGLIGMGRVGAEVIARMRAFGCRMLVSDPFLSRDQTPPGVELVALDELLEKSHIISVHCPLTEQTRHLLNRDTMAAMKQKPIVVNVSRGAIIDEAALLEALDQGRVACAGIDVLEREPPDPAHPLLHHPRALISNHMAWYSEEAKANLRTMTISRVVDFLQGRAIPNIVNGRQLQAADKE